MCDGRQAVLVVKCERDLATFNVPVARVEIVGIVPAVSVELTLHQRFSQQEEYLLAAHADLQLLDHFFCHKIALVNIGTIDVAVEAAAGKAGNRESKNGANRKRAKIHDEQKNPGLRQGQSIGFELPL